VLSPALGVCFSPTSSAALQASLRLAFFCMRQIVISSGLGMNALQSLNTSGVHAKRCSDVPCDERAGAAVVDSKATDYDHPSFHAGLDTRLPKRALVAKCRTL
jgi:hypothetical protein